MIKEECNPSATAFPNKIPKMMPAIPPSKQIITDSLKNCIMIFLRVAPIALLTPISRVLSLTDTNKIFIKPMPAPMSVRMPITMVAIFIFDRILINFSALLSLLLISKWSSSPGRTFLMFLKTPEAYSIVLSMSSALSQKILIL